MWRRVRGVLADLTYYRLNTFLEVEISLKVRLGPICYLHLSTSKTWQDFRSMIDGISDQSVTLKFDFCLEGYS